MNTIYPSLFGSVELPDEDHRPPRHRPDGVRVVRRPQTRPQGQS
jgi:hypothetical protein